MPELQLPPPVSSEVAFAANSTSFPSSAPSLAESRPVQSLPSEPPVSSSFPYLAVSFGAGFPVQQLVGTFAIPPVNLSVSQRLNAGFSGELGAGYKFSNARLELAVGYGSFYTDSQKFSNSVNTNTVTRGGSSSSTYVSYMVNGYYDFPVKRQDGSFSRWSPYVGLGVGLATLSTPGCYAGACFQPGSSSNFAYQAKAGLTYKLSTGSNLYVEGAYLGTPSFTASPVSYESFGSFRSVIGFRQRL